MSSLLQAYFALPLLLALLVVLDVYEERHRMPPRERRTRIIVAALVATPLVNVIFVMVLLLAMFTTRKP